MGDFFNKIQRVRNRQQIAWLWQASSTGLLTGGWVACGLALIKRIQTDAFPWTWTLYSSLIGLTVGILIATLRFRTLHGAACEIDSSCNLKDRFVTALDFGNRRNQGQALTPVQELQIQDAQDHAHRVDALAVAPIRSPRSFPVALFVNLSAAAILLVPIRSQAPGTPPVVNEVVHRQTQKLEKNFEDLRSMQIEQQDPELEKLLQELQSTLEEMKEPGVDPKEAMAKLSEMESALIEMQAQLNDPQAAAQLEKVGQALTLSPEMAQAGHALSKGDLDKAAEQLAKLDMPELDRQTEKSILEKLEQAKSQADSKKSSKQEKAENQIDRATDQMRQGLGQGNRSKFNEGAKGLSNETKKLSKRKKLSSLLKKQCESLSECKSECENECQSESTAKSSNPDNQAGKSAGDKAPGEKTSALTANQQMKLNGQDTGLGQSDTDTEKSDPQQEESLRAYRAQAEKFQSLSETALESESIPMGHRQTIRKYFESIRPTNEQVDRIKDKLKDQ